MCAVAFAVRVLRDLGNIAATNGVAIPREFGGGVDRPATNNSPAGPLSLRDFLFLTGFTENERLHPADKGVVRTSIIICVHNHASHTFQCLRSLLPEIDLTETEVIVADNASTDETDRLLAKFTNAITVLKNNENLGFVEGCNLAAKVAAGQYLIFLNNDTVVHPGWLPRLLETIESDASIGAVGSMLLDPDGSLQEAGGIVWRDGSAGNYGRGAAAADQKFAFARPVDYCSGAALLVRKDLFCKLGGFDKRYAPAYYEDVDLCFGIHSLGFRVIYQPLARVTHWEGTTAGTDITKGIKRYQPINRAKFFEKWRETLVRDQGEPQSDSLARAADRRPGPRIVVLDGIVPVPDQDGGSQRMFLILQALAKIGRPLFIPVNQAPSADHLALLGKHGIEVGRALDYKQALSDDEEIIVILSRVAVADEYLPLIRKAKKQTRIIFDTVDIHSLRLEREAELTGASQLHEEAAFRRKQEQRVVNGSDQIWCTTVSDSQAIKNLLPATSVKIVPTIHLPQGPQPGFEDREGLLFIGSFLHRPNRDAVEYFLRTIYPLVQQSLPDLRLYLVGSHMPDEILANGSDTIRCLGYVPDVEYLFQRSRVFVSPLRFGSGMKGKIGHSLSYGLPVVTTSIGAEGFGFAAGCEAMLADDPVEFAAAVIQAYTNQGLWQRLSKNGYRYVEEKLSPRVVNESIAAAIREVLT